MLNKKILGAAMLATVAVSSAAVAGDRDFNTVAGAVVGAAIGHNTGGRDGAVVGGLLGAAVGNSLGGNDRSYNNGGYYQSNNYQQAPVYYERQAPVYYERQAPVYYEPAPRYYSAPAVVYVEPSRGYYRERGGRWDDRRDYYGDRHDRHHGYYR